MMGQVAGGKWQVASGKWQKMQEQTKYNANKINCPSIATWFS